MRKKKWGYVCLVCLLLIGGVEGYLRLSWGFCDAVLIQADPALEYMAQPNQDRYRFKQHIVYNEYSQRNEAVDSSKVIILGLGDSVINGGTLTDQDSLATTLLTNTLSVDGKCVQVLNISAGSWGPDNCMAYLNQYGTFGAAAAFLVCSSHDVYDTMDFMPVVDTDVSFPSKQYRFALYELVDRYLYPRISSFGDGLFARQEVNPEEISHTEKECIHKNGKEFNPGFLAMTEYFRIRKLPFFILLHAEVSEQEQQKYNKEGTLILSFCQENQIPVVADLGRLSVLDYRDNIHVNESGQRKLYMLLMKQLITE